MPTFVEPEEGTNLGDCTRCAEPVIVGDGEYLTGEEARDGGVQHERCYDDDPED